MNKEEQRNTPRPANDNRAPIIVRETVRNRVHDWCRAFWAPKEDQAISGINWQTEIISDLRTTAWKVDKSIHKNVINMSWEVADAIWPYLAELDERWHSIEIHEVLSLERIFWDIKKLNLEAFIARFHEEHQNFFKVYNWGDTNKIWEYLFRQEKGNLLVLASLNVYIWDIFD